MTESLQAVKSVRLAPPKMMSLGELYSNIKTAFPNAVPDFPAFLSILDRHRGDLKIRQGELGVEVNYIDAL